MLHVACFDPGSTTGWCRFRVKPQFLKGRDIGECVRAGELEFGQEHVSAQKFDDWVHEAKTARTMAKETIDWWNGDGQLAVVFEDFILRRGGTAQRHTLSPVRMTAFMEANLSWYVALLAGSRRSSRAAAIARHKRIMTGFSVYGFTPAQAKSFATDDRLKHWNLWVKGNPHARDSLRHLCLFLAQYPGR